MANPGDAVQLPDAFVLSDRLSLDAQHRFLTSTRLQLLLLIAAGVLGVFTWRSGEIDLAALTVALSFALAAGLRLLLLRMRPHQGWYQGRAAAESIKTLAWRYAVCGQPFPFGAEQPDESFETSAREILGSLGGLPPDLRTASTAPTGSMRMLRAGPFDERRNAYLVRRIRDQAAWYDRKARWNRGRARFWGVSIFALQGVAAVGALAKGVGLVDVDLFGIASAVVASCAAWLETKQHGTLSAAYQVAFDELRSIEALAQVQDTEEAWAAFVAGAEEAMSREHTMWRASGTQVRPADLV